MRGQKTLLIAALVVTGFTSGIAGLILTEDAVRHVLLNAVTGLCIATIVGLKAGITIGRFTPSLNALDRRGYEPPFGAKIVVALAAALSGAVIIALIGWPLVPSPPTLRGLVGVFLGVLVWIVLPHRWE